MCTPVVALLVAVSKKYKINGLTRIVPNGTAAIHSNTAWFAFPPGCYRATTEVTSLHNISMAQINLVSPLPEVQKHVGQSGGTNCHLALALSELLPALASSPITIRVATSKTKNKPKKPRQIIPKPLIILQHLANLNPSPTTSRIASLDADSFHKTANA